MTLILLGSTFAVLCILGVACYRARLDLEVQLCECLEAPMAAAVGFGAAPDCSVATGPLLTGLDGGRAGGAPGDVPSRRHLTVVGAR